MTFERVVPRVFAVDLVVASGQSDEVIPHLRRKLNRLHEVLVALVPVQFVLVRLTHRAEREKPSPHPTGKAEREATRLPNRRGHLCSQRLARGVPHSPPKLLSGKQLSRPQPSDRVRHGISSSVALNRAHPHIQVYPIWSLQVGAPADSFRLRCRVPTASVGIVPNVRQPRPPTWRLLLLMRYFSEEEAPVQT